MRPNFFHHLHPPTIAAAQARLRHTLGAGGAAIFLVLVLAITGTLELFYYIPTPENAATSVQIITYLVPFGGLIRSLHYWSAQWLLIVSAVHLLRVVFTGAYAPPRRFNYLLGLALFVLIMLLNFSGYILRWDQGITWLLVAGSGLLRAIPWIGEAFYYTLTGGAQIGGATLLHYFALHLFGLSLAAFILMGWHAFRVRRDGGIAAPPANIRAQAERITRSELVQREVLAMLLTGSALILLSVISPAPIAAPLKEIPVTLEQSAAPWFLLWLQEMLTWGNPLVWGLGFPLLILATLALIPYIFPQPSPKEIGSWFPPSNRAAQIALGLITLLIIVLSLVAYVR